MLTDRILSEKFRAGEHPTFKNSTKSSVADEISKFVIKNPEAKEFIFYPDASSKNGLGYNDDKIFILAVTSAEVYNMLHTHLKNLFVIKDYSGKTHFDVEGVFRIRISSGRGFSFSGEGGKSNPKTSQQELGTIMFLEFFLKNGTYPTNEEINDLVGFKFDSGWYKSFSSQTNAIMMYFGSNLTSSSKIELDSDKKKIGNAVFSMFKKLPDVPAGVSKDNWNPADIWIYENRETVISKLSKAKTVVEFNNTINYLFEQRELVGVSLKKASKVATAKVVRGEIKEFDLKPSKSTINIKTTYVDIQTTGSENEFFIRSRAKAGNGTIGIYFEGKEKGSTTFLGAIDKKLVSSLTGFSDNILPDDLSKKSLIGVLDKLSAKNDVVPTDYRSVFCDECEIDDRELKRMYVLYTYMLKIQSLEEKDFNRLVASGYKMNDYSSTHLKVS